MRPAAKPNATDSDNLLRCSCRPHGHIRKRDANCARPCCAGLRDDTPSATLTNRSPWTTVAHRQSALHAKCLPQHHRPPCVDARGVFIHGRSEPTVTATGHMPAEPLYADAGAMAPFAEDRTQRRALTCRESWRGSGCASGFMAATVQRNDFPRQGVPSSRNKIAAPPGPPRCCGRFAMRPARTSPFGSPTRPRWARP